jgi:hypothetical protein
MREQVLGAAVVWSAEHGYRLVNLGDIGGRSAALAQRPIATSRGRTSSTGFSSFLANVCCQVAKERVTVTTSRVEVLARRIDFHAGFAAENPVLITADVREHASLAPEDQRRVPQLQRAYLKHWADAVLEAIPLVSRENPMAIAHAPSDSSTPHSSGVGSTVQMRSLSPSMAPRRAGGNHAQQCWQGRMEMKRTVIP